MVQFVIHLLLFVRQKQVLKTHDDGSGASAVRIKVLLLLNSHISGSQSDTISRNKVQEVIDEEEKKESSSMFEERARTLLIFNDKVWMYVAVQYVTGLLRRNIISWFICI